MRAKTLIYSGLVAILTSGLAACSSAATGPDIPSDFSSDRTGATTGIAARPDSAQRLRCRADTDLTEREIAKIRSLYNAYLVAIAPDVALIDKVNQAAREALQNGASREEIAKILSRADEAKRNVAAATRRLRAAIVDILNDDRLPCFVVVVTPAG